MSQEPTRRQFLQAAAAVGAMGFAGLGCQGPALQAPRPALISPGCRKSKVRVAKIYMGRPGALWPTPTLDLEQEVARYERHMAGMSDAFADVDFVVDELVTKPEQMRNLKGKLHDVDGILAIHLSMGIGRMLPELLGAGRPTVLFAAPYSGHEWTGFGAWMNRKEGALLDCLLTSDLDQLAVAVRPFRAMHHLREAKILNVTTRNFEGFADAMKEKFGTGIVKLGRDRVLAAYEAVPDDAARAEAERWIAGAEKVVEPSREEIVKSSRLALAMDRLLTEEEATVFTVDCYGTMWRKLPAYPCIGFARLNNMGLGGICESDLQSAMTHILYQGLVGRPGFISDPTMDLSRDSIICAHCLGTPKMDGPAGKAAPYRLRTIMERREGAVPQVRMRLGQKVTQAKLVGADQLLCFTGEIIDTPDLPRGCRTKITVKVDGDAERLWRNWSHGLHRVTCYGDLTADLRRFCRFAGVEFVQEA